MKSFKIHWPLLLIFILTGCQDREIVSYEVPKENHTPPTPTTSPAEGAHQLVWHKPEGWQEQPATGFRKGSFTAGEVDISISTFPDQAGGLLANINRWRGQIDLEPIDEGKLAGETTPVEIGGIQGVQIDIIALPEEDSDPADTRRIVGAVVSVGGSAWFFKMIGPDKAVEREKGAFETLLKSVHPASGHSAHPGDSGTRTPMAAQAGAIPAPPKAEPFQFEAPPGWMRQPPSSFRAASFQIPGDSVPNADLSVIALPGSAGGDLANVNRWRRQINLPPVSESELTASASLIESGAYRFQLYDMVSATEVLEGGHRARVLAAILKQGNTSWFFKLTGEDQLVAGEKAAFIQFLESFKLEGAP